MLFRYERRICLEVLIFTKQDRGFPVNGGNKSYGKSNPNKILYTILPAISDTLFCVFSSRFFDILSSSIGLNDKLHIG